MASETSIASQLQVRFKRNDIYTVGTTNRGTLRVIPVAKRTRQRLVVGDHGGMVHCFQVGKHHEVKADFSIKSEVEGAITRVELFKDQVFVGCANRITAYTKKGKPFYINETSLSEPILHLRVYTPYQPHIRERCCFASIPRLLDIWQGPSFRK